MPRLSKHPLGPPRPENGLITHPCAGCFTRIPNPDEAAGSGGFVRGRIKVQQRVILLGFAIMHRRDYNRFYERLPPHLAWKTSWLACPEYYSPADRE